MIALDQPPAAQVSQMLAPACANPCHGWTGEAMPGSERKTENIIRAELRRLGYTRPGSQILVEEQKSEIEAVKRLMRAASKSGGGGIGAPEFIVSRQPDPDFLIIIECKADRKDHVSDSCSAALSGGAAPDEDEEKYAKRVQRYAVDGVLHYANRLAKEYTVIAVGISGD